MSYITDNPGYDYTSGYGMSTGVPPIWTSNAATHNYPGTPVHPQVWKNNTGQNYSVPHAYLTERSSAGPSSPTDFTSARQNAYYSIQHGLHHTPTELSYPDPAMSSVYFPKKRGRKPLADKGKKRRKRNRPGSHVKRAKTAYFFFLEVFRKNYVKEGDQIPRASEITKACGAKWGLMNEEEKRPHQEKAIADRKRYEGEMAMYRKVRDPDKPKKPPTAYFYFLTDFRARMKGKPIEKGRRLTEICGEEWNKLTEDQKRPYLDRVAVEYKKYQEAMEEWRKKKGMQAATASKKPSTTTTTEVAARPSAATTAAAAQAASAAAVSAASNMAHIPESVQEAVAAQHSAAVQAASSRQAHQAVSPPTPTQMIPMGSHMAPMGALAGGYNHAASMQQMQQMLLQQHQMQAVAASMARHEQHHQQQQQQGGYDDEEYEDEDYEEEG
ncbi:uncharacterized protein [Apostichopus japonicus]|uniref:uncharacterized protein isoform X11 n=1 Tax=Stichopus japonicus TaxID=307972 RepID=UPI003AB5FBBF